MEKIKKLLAEYEIRFRDTDEILKGPPHLDCEIFNKGEYNPSVASNEIYNRNGCVYDYGHWATAKLTKEPEKWVVEKDENHPMWLRFKEMSIWRNFDRVFQTYYSDDKSSTILLDFEGYQYLTLDQWAEFYLPKVDFSIHNDCEFFFVKTCRYRSWLSRGKLTEGNCISFCLNNNILDTIGHLVSSKDEIIEFRRPTEEEFNTLYQYHPEYAVMEEKELYGLFWNESAPDNKVVRCLKSATVGPVYSSSDGGWDHFYKFSPKLQKLLREEIYEIGKKLR